MAAHTSAVHVGWRAHPTLALKVYFSTGRARVEAWDRDSIDFSGRLAEGESLFGMGTTTGRKMGVEGTALRGRSDMVLRVPRGARLIVRSGAAALDVSGVRGSLDAGAAAGAVSVDGAPSTLLVETISGDIRLDVRTANVRARSTEGDITLAGDVGEAQLATVDGSVQVTAIRGTSLPALRVETVAGAVRLVGRVSAVRLVDLSTFSGRVDVELPADQGAVRVDARSSGVVSVHTTARGAGKDVPAITIRSFRGAISVRHGR